MKICGVVCPLLILKFAVFFLNAAWNSCLQYLGLHALQIGFTVAELAIVQTSISVATCIGPPILGIIADKMGNHKLVLIMTVIVSTACHMSLLLFNTDPPAELSAAANATSPLHQNSTLGSLDSSDSRNSIFTRYLILRLFGAFTYQASVGLFDSTTVAIVKKYAGGVGRQKIFALLSRGLFSFLSSAFLQWTVHIYGRTEYGATIYLYGALTVVSLPFLILLEDVFQEREVSSLTSEVFSIFRKIDVLAFVFVLMTVGACSGFNNSFSALFLVDIGAPSYLLGLTYGVRCLTGIPFLFFSDTLVRKFGSPNVLGVALLFYCIRYGGYSVIRNPWFSLLFDSLVSSSLATVCANYYSAAIASHGALATVNGFMNTVQGGIGKTVGNAIGGALVVQVGYRLAFSTFCAATAGIVVIYFGLYNLIFKRREKGPEPQPYVDLEASVDTESTI